MTAALIALALTNLGITGCFAWLLHKRDEREARDRQLLLNRIQAPETAVAQTVAMEEVELLPPDTEWTEADEHERLISTFTEGS